LNDDGGREGSWRGRKEVGREGEWQKEETKQSGEGRFSSSL